MSQAYPINLPSRDVYNQVRCMARKRGYSIGKMAVEVLRIGFEQMDREQRDGFKRLQDGVAAKRVGKLRRGFLEVKEKGREGSQEETEENQMRSMQGHG